MSKKDNKDCFIVMPITTPIDYVDRYGNDSDHFSHVLNHLFIPAIKMAGYNPIPPLASGSDLIHAKIIEKIESCPFLLCDMSILNANVFFELGIRTALNKPVALVRDDLTKHIPFDISLINHETYSHGIAVWDLDVEIQKLSSHLVECFSDKKDNSLWTYFGISGQAAHLNESPGQETEFAYLTKQLTAVRNEVKQLSLQNNSRPLDNYLTLDKLTNQKILENNRTFRQSDHFELDKGLAFDPVFTELEKQSFIKGFTILNYEKVKNLIKIEAPGMPFEVMMMLQNECKSSGYKLEVNGQLVR